MGGIRYGKPYASRSPTAVSSPCYSFLESHPVVSSSRGPDFERINAAQRASLTLDQKSELLWGSRRYRDPASLVLEEDGLVGLLKAQPNMGKKTVAATIDAFLALYDLDQLVIRADDTGYVALFSQGKTTLHIRYFAGDDSAVIHRYGMCKSNPARYRRKELQKEAPQPNEEGWRDGTLTEEMGVILYDRVPLLSPNGVKVSVRSARKKPCVYSPGKYLQDTSTSSVTSYLRTELPYAFATAFPSAAEKEKLRQGDAVQFTIRFKGYRAYGTQDAHRNQELRKAYDDGLSLGIHAVLGNVYAVTSAEKQPCVLSEGSFLQQAQ